MDMTVIDTVPASTLAEGDVIRYDDDKNECNARTGSLQEVIKFEDDGFVVYLFLEDSGEVEVHPDLLVNLYGYPDSED
jgi:hypothetical protein